MSSYTELKPLAANNWRGIHASAGISVPNTHLKHCACQGCGGTDRFRIAKDYEETGGFFCGQGDGSDTTGGDGFRMLEHVVGMTWQEALDHVRECLNVENDWKKGKADSAEQRARLKRIRAESEARIAKAQAEKEVNQQRVAVNAKARWDSAIAPLPYQGYLHKKGLLNTRRLKQSGSMLLMDVVDSSTDEFLGLQAISPEGGKMFNKGMRTEYGLHWLNGTPNPKAERISVCEGWATGASINEKNMAIALNCHNMGLVIAVLLNRYPRAEIICYADDSAGNKETSKKMAKVERMKRVTIKYPKWPNNKRPEWATDFNDLKIILEDIQLAEDERLALQGEK